MSSNGSEAIQHSHKHILPSGYRHSAAEGGAGDKGTCHTYGQLTDSCGSIDIQHQ